MNPQQQLNEILQQQLRDVHLPEPISWWPLAAPWWALLCLIVLALFFAIRAFRNNRARNAYRRHAVSQLSAHYKKWQSNADTSAYLQSANAVLKRASLHLDESARQLSGSAWLRYLSQFSPHNLSELTETALSQGIYQKAPEYDVEKIQQELTQWLLKHESKLTLSDIEVNHA